MNSIKLYQNNNRLETILQYSDYSLQTNLDLFNSLFPLFVDKNSLISFQTPEIKENITRVVLRLLIFLGYAINIDEMITVQVKPLYREERGITLGLYSKDIYPYITQMFKFIAGVHLNQLYCLVFVSICNAIKKDKKIKEIITRSGQYPIWMRSHPILFDYTSLYDIENVHYALKKQRLTCLPANNDNENENETIQFYPYSGNNILPSFRGLDYISNSCYLDSVLVALFANSNSVINKHMLNKDIYSLKRKWIVCGKTIDEEYKHREQIQKELNRIAISIQGGEQVKDCSLLKEKIEKCQSSQPFHRNGMQDAGEFLLFLFNIFEVSVMTKRRTTYITNSLDTQPDYVIKTFEENQLSSPVINISVHTLNKEPRFDLNQFLVEKEDAILDKNDLYRNKDGELFRRRIEEITVLSSPYIVFNANRLYLNNNNVYERNETILDLPEEIVISRYRLYLHAVVVHQCLHYTVFIKNNELWFYYDDIPNRIDKIGSFQDLIDTGVGKNGILYFYSVVI